MADFGTVARPYARAVFDIAMAEGGLDGWSRALGAAAAVVAEKSARAYLGRPGVAAAERGELVASVAAELEGAAAAVLGSPEGKNLLELLAENDRLEALGEISAQFDRLKAEQENRVKVRLVAASAVSSAQAEKIASALSLRLGRAVELDLEVDESLIGGAVVHAEDRVIDDSLKTRLTRLASALTD